MSDSDAAGFGKFVPGFDFLQNLAKGATSSVPQMPNLGSWVAPTLSVEELDKRIEELKNVQFWLEQNSRALSATIQALEVQRMTLATLKGMNFNLAEVAKAFTPKAAPAASSKNVDKAEKAAEKPVDKASDKASDKAAADTSEAGAGAAGSGKAGGGMADPLLLWGALTQQFQQIATTALKEVASQSASHLGKGMAAAAKPAAKAAAKKAPAKKAARKPAARKSAK